jgi:hypothetical protein
MPKQCSIRVLFISPTCHGNSTTTPVYRTSEQLSSTCVYPKDIDSEAPSSFAHPCLQSNYTSPSVLAISRWCRLEENFRLRSPHSPAARSGSDESFELQLRTVGSGGHSLTEIRTNSGQTRLGPLRNNSAHRRTGDGAFDISMTPHSDSRSRSRYDR